MIRLFGGAARRVRNDVSDERGRWQGFGGAVSWPFGGRMTKAGKRVTTETAMEVSAVWDCVRKTAEVISTLPLTQYQKSNDGSRDVIEDDVSDLLTVSPNREQTAQEFWESMVAHMVLRGNGCSERGIIGKRTVSLIPLPNAVPFKKNGVLQYEFFDRGKRQILPAEKVFHLRGFGVGDGIGLSAIRYGANSIGGALAADETSSRVFSNAMMLAGVLRSDQTLNSDQRGQLSTMLETFVGSEKAGKTLVLESGLKFEQVQMNPEDAQLLETRRFQVEDVCRWFGVPPIVIGHAADGQTMWGSGVEQIMLSWLTLGINPLLKKIEARILKDMQPPQHRRKRYFEFNREAMLQMDSKAKGTFLGVMANTATMTANERRAKLNLPRHADPNADELLAQGAMVLLPSLGKEENT